VKNFSVDISRLAGLLLVGLVFNSPALATFYKFTELAPYTGGVRSNASAINNLGQIVGNTDFNAPCFGCGGYTRATIWDGSTGAPLSTPTTNSYASDINDLGQVVGWLSVNYTTSREAVIWDNMLAPTTTLDTIYYYDSAVAINNHGQIVGNSAPLSNSYRKAVVWNSEAGTTYLGISSQAVDINDVGQVAGRIGSDVVIWTGGTATVLGDLDGGFSVAEAINNSGQAVGWSLAAGGYRAVLWKNTAAIDLGTLGGFSYAYGINNIGQIVGSFYAVDGMSHAFLWEDGALIDLNTLLENNIIAEGWLLTSAQDINDNGEIVGNALNRITGQSSAFLLSMATISEPYSIALFCFGLTGIGVIRRRSVLAAHSDDSDRSSLRFRTGGVL